jgi:hypothetical protein
MPDTGMSLRFAYEKSINPFSGVGSQPEQMGQIQVFLGSQAETSRKDGVAANIQQVEIQIITFISRLPPHDQQAFTIRGPD